MKLPTFSRAWFIPVVLSLLVLLRVRGEAEQTKPATQTAGAGPIVDLDADKGVEVAPDGKVNVWKSQVDFKARDFKAVRDDGHPMLRKNVEALHGHNALVFEKQELLNTDEDAFDHLTTGSGYTWFAVLAVHRQVTMEKDVNAFFGNLKNGGNYEGFWAGVTDDNEVWDGSRNSTTFGRWDDNNPRVLGPKLDENRFYVLAGRMGAGTGKVMVELFVNDPKPVAARPFPVNPNANPSKMEIGQERDATNHPGRESFKGEIARITFWDRPLTDEEMADQFNSLKTEYGVK